MTKTFGDYVVLLISLIGGFASILAFGFYFAPHLNNQGWIGVFFLGIITFFFLGYNYYLISKYRRKIKYADIHEDLNMGFASLHSIDRANSESISLIGQYLIDLCDSISNAFTKLNGNHIGACIKFLTFDGNRPRALTLVRDRKSSIKNRKTGSKDKTKHWLDANSDFDFIYSNFDNENIDTAYYYAIRLPCKNDYRNSRLKNWPPKTKLFLLNNVIRQKQWPLPYKSTLVVPIVPLLANEQEQTAIRGFLCIDSPRNVAFNKNIDVEILKGISDALYNKIDKLHELIENDNGKN